MKHSGFLKSVAIISAGGIIAKGVGALYRVSLVRYLGGWGMGLYQMAYPLFCLLLTFSSAGIPSAFSRIVAGEEARGGNTRSTLKTALALFLFIGLCGMALMAALSPVMAAVQNEENLRACYRALAPSVTLVALIAVLRGYYQGRNDMLPTAGSEIIEQLVKAAAGLYFAARYAGQARAVVACLWAVTISEGAALLFLLLRLRGEVARGAFLRPRRTAGIEILYGVLPVMLACAVLPLSQTVDSVLLPRLMPVERTRAVSLYGLFTGGAVSLINLPATACYGLAAATVPAVSSKVSKGDLSGARKSVMFSLGITLSLSLSCALGLLSLARPIVALLYPSLSQEDSGVLVSLIRILSFSAVALSGVETLNACLTGMGRARRSALAMFVAVCVKTALQFLLVPILSVKGAAIASTACYFVAFFLDLFYTVRKPKEVRNDNDNRARCAERRLDGAGVVRIEEGEKGVRTQRVARLRRAQRSGNKL